MEKVWEELKKIEAQAQEIRSEAQKNAKEITALAQKESEELIADGKTFAQEVGQRLYERTVEEANRSRDQQLSENRAAVEKLGVQADGRMEKAVSVIVGAVLGEKQA